MKSLTPSAELQTLATEALKSLLGQVSAIKLKEMLGASTRSRNSVEFLVHVEVFGHSHLLACEARSSAEPSQLRTILRRLCDHTAQLAAEATPVIIAPFLSPEAQQLCKKCQTGFLDLEGNARLAFGEVFIGKRSHPQHQSILHKCA